MYYKPTIHILLATYNGAKYVKEQLDSILLQSYDQWTLTVSDDGSTDETMAIVEAFSKKVLQPIFLLQGPLKHSSTFNFFHLIQNAPVVNEQDLYAFCDQDDVWLSNKLESAVMWHKQNLQNTARLYCGRTHFVNEKLLRESMSPSIRLIPSLGNSLVQNIASGNTMVFSFEILCIHKKINPSHSVWHDWTTYIIATAIEAEIKFDDKAYVLYRQHESNVIGANNRILPKIYRLRSLLQGQFKEWTNINMAAISDIYDLITPQSQILYNKFSELRILKFSWSRLSAWKSTPIRRQTYRSNIMLAFAIFLGLI